MKKDERKTPLLDPKIKKEQDIKEPNNSEERDSPNPSKEPVKEDPEDVPESNDPAGYGDAGRIKKGPYEKED